MEESLRKLWAWVNSKTIAPWLIAGVTAIGSLFYMQATVSAQEAEIEELKRTTEDRMDIIHDSIINRLDDIKEDGIRRETKIDQLQEDVATLKANASRRR